LSAIDEFHLALRDYRGFGPEELAADEQRFASRVDELADDIIRELSEIKGRLFSASAETTRIRFFLQDAVAEIQSLKSEVDHYEFLGYCPICKDFHT
jgi:hypothetical protein